MAAEPRRLAGMATACQTVVLGIAALLVCASSVGDSWTAETERLTRPNDESSWPPPYVSVLDARAASGRDAAHPLVRSAAEVAPKLWSQIPELLGRIRDSTDVIEVKRSARPRVIPGCCTVESSRLKDTWASASSHDVRLASGDGVATRSDFHVFAGALPRAVTRGLAWQELQADALLSKLDSRATTSAVDSSSGSSRGSGGGSGDGAPPTGREGALQARIAPLGAVTPLHYDSGANVVLQVVGRKTWWLLPPAWLSALSPYPKLHLRHRQSQLSLHDLAELHNGTLPRECAADANGLPFSGRLRLNSTIAAKARAEVYRVDLQPGDLLYIPPFWAHEVTATTTTRAEAALASIAGVDDA
jgi:hypothetical protein